MPLGNRFVTNISELNYSVYIVNGKPSRYIFVKSLKLKKNLFKVSVKYITYKIQARESKKKKKK